MDNQNKIWVIVIDPFIKEVKRIKIDNDWELLKKTIDLDKDDLVEAVRLYSYPSTHVLCDENGRLKEGDKRYVQVGEHVYTGKVLLIGSEGEEFDSCKVKMTDVMPLIDFKNKDYMDSPIAMWLTNGG
jgi:hypothetical protein